MREQAETETGPRDLLSKRVRSGTYFFLDLTQRRSGRFSLALGGRENCGGSYEVKREDYPFYNLEYVAEGRGWLRLGSGPELVLEPGSFFAYGPGVPHHFGVAPGCSLLKYFICLTGAGARRRLERPLALLGGCLLQRNHGEVRGLLDWLLGEAQRRGQRSQLLCTRLFEVILLKLAEESSLKTEGSDPDHAAFVEAKVCIDAQAPALSNLDEVCRATRLSPSKLGRLFRRYQGASPYHYLVRRKMELAAQELLRSGFLIKELAARLGYADAFHFSRLFKAAHGLSPAAFRERFLASRLPEGPGRAREGRRVPIPAP